MIVSFLIGAAVGAAVTLAIVFLDEIIDWAKEQLRKLASWIKKAKVRIKRLPGAIKQFIYYVEHGTVKVKTEERNATQDEIDELRNSMTEKEWRDFMSGKQTDIADIEREDD